MNFDFVLFFIFFHKIHHNLWAIIDSQDDIRDANLISDKSGGLVRAMSYYSSTVCHWLHESQLLLTLTSASIWWRIIGLLANSTKGLGRVRVNGLKRVPKPLLLCSLLESPCVYWVFVMPHEITTTCVTEYNYAQVSFCLTSHKNQCFHLLKCLF